MGSCFSSAAPSGESPAAAGKKKAWSGSGGGTNAAARYAMDPPEVDENSDTDSDPESKQPAAKNELGYTDLGQFKRDYTRPPRGGTGARGPEDDDETDAAEDLLKSYAAAARKNGTGARPGKRQKIIMKSAEVIPGMVYEEDDGDVVGVGSSHSLSAGGPETPSDTVRTFEQSTAAGFAPRVGGIAFDVTGGGSGSGARAAAPKGGNRYGI